jgi:choline-sulfatase
MKQPNILLVTTDQQRFDTVGERAPRFLRTPHLDVLRREGVEFTRAYTDCPICVPARTTIMTGRYALNHRMTHNGETIDVMGHSDTLPALLGELGYQTAAIGKMHFGPQRVRHGFHEMIIPDDYYRHMQRNGAERKPMRHGLGQNELYPGMATVPEAQTITSWIAEQSLEYIRERRDPSRPFFLWCSFSKPHPPFDPPEPYYSMYRNCEIPEPVHGDWCDDEHAPESFKRFRQRWSLDLVPTEVIREARAAYYGLVTQVDYNLGRVFAALQDMGLYDDTLVIFTSDHGEMLGDHRTGAKVFFHEPSAHIPFLLRMPKSWRDRLHGSQCPDLVSLADILPTLIVAAGGAPPAGTDGLDLVSLVRGELPAGRDYLEATAEPYGPATTPYLAITDGRYKYIWYPEGADEQLFDLEEDPNELRNLNHDEAYTGVKATLRDVLVKRERARGGVLLNGGALLERPHEGDSERDRRNQAWPGFHTEYFPLDVRH